MPTLVQHIIVDASADAVWEVIGHRFDRIGEWATAVPASTAAARSVSPVDAAPVTGRVCDTGIRLMPRVTETIVAFDDTARTLTYRADDLPAFVAMATNTWTVTQIDQGRRPSASARTCWPTRGYGA
jgi:Polyketide cyclase / dehydrase and lipid transport